MSASFFLIDPEQQPELWAEAWDKLAFDGINVTQPEPQVCECPTTGEVWQYMGSQLTTDDHITAHDFRHRHHPVVNRAVRKRVHIRRQP